MKNLSLKMQTTALMSLIMAFFISVEMHATTEMDPSLFYDGTYENARAKAGEEGKLFMVDFYANWCTPCKWMEKTTFQNTAVKQLLAENYVSIKIDIDQPEGYDLKEKYGVTMLPTILIFNSQGQMVERIEKTLTAESLLTVLGFHNHSMNKVVQKHSLNISPKAALINTNGDKKEDYNKMYADYKQMEKRRSDYRIQVANYDNYEAAFIKVNEIRDIFFEPIIVLNDYRDGITWYKVLLGEFKTMEEAESFRIILKNDFNIEGIIN